MQAGKYPCVVTGHEWTTSSNSNLGLRVRAKVRNSLGEEAELSGTIWITLRSAKMARQQLRALGFDPDTDDIDDIGESISLIGAECDCSVRDGKYGLQINMFLPESEPVTAEHFTSARTLLASAKSENGDAESEPVVSPLDAATQQASEPELPPEDGRAEQATKDSGDIPF